LSKNHLEQIRIPQNTLVVLCGIAGCGKSTFAAKHFLPTQIVSSDECRARICDDPMNQKVTGQAFELWRFIIRTRLWLWRLSVADATNLDRGDRKWLVKTAQNYNFLSSLILFNIPLETALRRNATRERVVPEEALLRQYELLQNSLLSVPHEHFDSFFIVSEEEQNIVTVEISPEGTDR
jgi:predicted kinase